MSGTPIQWAALVAYGVALFVVAPRADGHRGFLWARNPEGAAPSTALLTGSVLVTWIFAKSITNAANLGEKYGLVGGLAYAGWYLSIPAAGLLLYRVRKAGHEGIIPFLTARFGPSAAFLFAAAILIRLYNEVWSNTEVVASYFGAPGSAGFFGAAGLFTAAVLVYTLRGGLRASIFTDQLQLALAVVLLGWVLFLIVPAHAPADLARTARFELTGGVDLLLVALLQITSYPFHDPVLTDRAFVNPPRKMLAAFLLAGLLGAAFIVLYSLIGVHLQLAGPHRPGDAPVRAAALLGSGALLVVSVLMMNSAGACVDSTFTAVARFAAVDLGGEGGAHPSGFRGLVAPLRRFTAADHGVRLGRACMIGCAVLGNLPLLWHADILKATTLSGTMVLGLAPPFLFWKAHRPAPLAFHLSFFCGIGVGILALLGRWPAALTVGRGAYAALLGQNLAGLGLCGAAYAAGVAVECARAREASGQPGFFAPVAAAAEER
ncbi:MAG: sodium:solute symporter [Myxococcales bacterium]